MRASAGTLLDSRTAAQQRPAADVSQAVRRAELLHGILYQLNRKAPAEEWAQAVAPILAESVGGATSSVVRVISETEARVLAAYGPTRKRGYPYPAIDLRDPTLSALRQRSAVLVLRREERSLLQPALRALMHPHFGTAVIVSALVGHKLGGFLVLSCRTVELLDTGVEEYLMAVADAVGLALSATSLSHESSMSEAMLETACAVARAISGSLDLSRTFTQIAQTAARVMGDCSCLLLELDAESGDLVAVACSDPADEVLRGLRVRFEDAPSNYAALERRRSIVLDDVVWGASVDRVCRDRLEIKSALFVPIHSEEGLIGSLLLYSDARRSRYSDSDVARAGTVAEQAASAICNARLYRDLERSESRAKDLLERITRLRERQRLTFADVLHDDIVQNIVAALYQVEGLRAASGPQPREDLNRVSALLKQVIADARVVIWSLRPPVLDGLGLDGALHALVKRVAGDSDVSVELHAADLPLLPPGFTSALYMIAREALQNVHKHASAQRCALSLTTYERDNGSYVRLRISDDGVGFQLGDVSTADHFGLTMIQEQAALVGGSMQVVAELGGGTTIEVEVPLPAEGVE